MPRRRASGRESAGLPAHPAPDSEHARGPCPPKATGIEFRRTGTDEPVTVDAGLVLSSIGYRGTPIAGLPFDTSAAVVPNDQGGSSTRLTSQAVPGTYVAGWIKRGPPVSSAPTSPAPCRRWATLVDDFNTGLLADPIGRPAALRRLVRSRRPEVVDADGWRAIDAAEIAAARLPAGRG